MCFSVADAENNNLASLVSSVSDSMVEFVNVDGEVGVPSTRPPLLHVVPPAPQLHRLFTEHNISPSSSSSAPLPSLPTLSRAEEDAPVHLGLTMGMFLFHVSHHLTLSHVLQHVTFITVFT